MEAKSKRRLFLILQDGCKYEGFAFGSLEEKAIYGELVFQTGMVGYPESLTDPSYCGQLLVLTYPLIGNYGVPDVTSVDEFGLPENVESSKIWVSGLIVDEYSNHYSHWRARQSLSQWLASQSIPAIEGIDTRALTKKIRDQGSTLAALVPDLIYKVSNDGKHLSNLSFIDPNTLNLLERVSTKKMYTINETGTKRIAVIDVGVKVNQIRYLARQGFIVDVLPWNSPFGSFVNKYDGFFISNGPGNPETAVDVIENIKQLLESNVPIFGICLGHQLIARAIGLHTRKMLYGNRGHNLPCRFIDSNRSFVTTQNHGYAVDVDNLPDDWMILFTNINDSSNEGLAHRTKAIFSVQFHPEHNAGPKDMNFLFDIFTNYIRGNSCDSVAHEIACHLNCTTGDDDNLLQSYTIIEEANAGEAAVDDDDDDLTATTVTTGKINGIIKPKKVLILGSGGLSIGQAGEFDYSGSQAIKALKEEAIKAVLINPNIATVQTDPSMADKVYFLPITFEYVVSVIEWERPDGIFLMFGGQTALNCGIQLEEQGILAKYNIKVLGTPIKSIVDSEDRQRFACLLEQVPGATTVTSQAAKSIDEAIEIANNLKYPVLIRAAFALGGLGSGFANDEHQLKKQAEKCLVYSSQVFIDKSLKGWKEVEYEVVRDKYNNCVTVCNMENVDPLGVHTGESIVVAPSQTLDDHEYNLLRSTAIKIAQKLGIIGECNVQYALSPRSNEYYVVEVNARLSRSSALASKATGYPLAYIAAKLALGYSLPSIINSMTKKTSCFEPSLDYCVVKIPRWDLGKFNGVSRRIGSSMKSVGEVMAIGRKFEEALQKALRMVDENVIGFDGTKIKQVDEGELESPSDQRIFVIAAALHQGYTIDRLNQLTQIDKWFLQKMKNIINYAQTLQCTGYPVDSELLREGKKFGFSDKQIASFVKSSELVIRNLRQKYHILPFVKQIDTVSAEWPAHTNYLYTTYNAIESDIEFNMNDVATATDTGAVMVLGSGVYRIGSSVEFDCCSVACVQQLRRMGRPTIMVNYNPETVSTDYDMCDKLYFDELSFEVVMDIYELENPSGIILCMGGQLPNNIAMDLFRQRVPILGTSPESIDDAENRFKFSRLLDRMASDKILQPEWRELRSWESAKEFCELVGYPCVVRPSYVLSGAAMNVATRPSDLEKFLKTASEVSKDHPVVISKYIVDAKEIDVDAVAQQGRIIAIAVSEHVENAGVHSGDATLVTPPRDLNEATLSTIETICSAIARELQVNGPFNMQLIAKDDELKIIECNLRVSRSFPFVSKVLDFDFVAAATRVMLGEQLETHNPIIIRNPRKFGVKVAQFSFSRLPGADFALGVEMASTGEVACFGETHHEAYLKALISTGFKLPRPNSNILLSIGTIKHKRELYASVKQLYDLGYNLFASKGTADFYMSESQEFEKIGKIGKITPIEWPFPEIGEEEATNNQVTSIAKYLQDKEFELVINLPSRTTGSHRPSTHGYRIRRFAVEFSIPLLTDVKCAKLFVESLSKYSQQPPAVKTHVDCLTSRRLIKLPGLIDVHVHLRDPGQTYKEDFDTGTSAALAGGITIVCAMPNTQPEIASMHDLQHVRSIAAAKARCDYGLFVIAKNNHQEWLKITKDNPPIALKIYMNETFTESRMSEITALNQHLKYWPENLPICVHAEGLTVAGIILLAQLSSRRIHICHVARGEEILLIKMAKANKIPITCEVCPHHLFLTEEDAERLDCPRDDVTGEKIKSSSTGFGEVRPRLGTKEDQATLWANLDVIDCFASDHAPHQVSEKEGPNAPPGFPGLETMLPLLLNAVNQGRLKLQDIEDKMYTNPKKIFNIPDQPDTYVEVDMDQEWVIGEKPFHSKSKWSPFQGFKVKGKVSRVVLRGELAFVDDKVVIKRGSGKEIIPMARFSRDTHTQSSPQNSMFNLQKEEVAPRVTCATETVASEMYPPKIRSNTISELSPSIMRPLAPLDIRDTLNASVAGILSPTTMSSGRDIHLLKGQNILKAEQFTRQMLHSLFNLAQTYKSGKYSQLLAGKVMASLFFEASTRTSCSFTAAMMRLGGQMVPVSMSDSSLKKGESHDDTVSTLASYCDCLVIRHSEPGAIERFSKLHTVKGKPIINAGDGIGEHPTQALLDVFTIREELGTVNNKIITIVGDLKNGRTVHSLIQLLALYQVSVKCISPASLALPREVRETLDKLPAKNTNFTIQHYTGYNDFEAAIQETDILYMTRIQRERFQSPEEYDKLVTSGEMFRVTPELITKRKSKKKIVVMHPLPRVGEIEPEFDTDPQAAYFRQMENGMYVRMALLTAIFGKVPHSY